MASAAERTSRFSTIKKSAAAAFHRGHANEQLLVAEKETVSDKLQLLEEPTTSHDWTGKTNAVFVYEQLERVPIARLQNVGGPLVFVDLSHNSILAICDELSQFVHIECLVISCNRLRNIGTVLSSLVNLRYLNLSNNMLTTEDVTASKLEQLPQLQELYLSDNDIKSFPKTIPQMTRLQKLSLSNNRLEEIPTTIAHLTELLWIGLSKNLLTNIEPLFSLKKLKGISIYDNPLENIQAVYYQLQHFLPVSIINQPESSDLQSMDKVKRCTMELSREIRKELHRGGGQHSPFDKDGSSPSITRSTFSMGKKPVKPKKGTSSLHKVLHLETSESAEDTANKLTESEKISFLPSASPISPMAALFLRRSTNRIDTSSLKPNLSAEIVSATNLSVKGSTERMQTRKSKDISPETDTS